MAAQVGFGQNHHRRGAAVPANGQITLQPPQIKILVHGHADKDRVDIAGNHLLLLGCARRLADKGAFSREHMVDDGMAARVALPVQHDKIAHCGKIRGPLRFMPETSAISTALSVITL